MLVYHILGLLSSLSVSTVNYSCVRGIFSWQNNENAAYLIRIDRRFIIRAIVEATGTDKDCRGQILSSILKE